MSPPPQDLPPALVRLASALELSSGFLLYFITGPRDHADSVYLRLLALTPDFELVRHRIQHVGDLEFFDVLTSSADDRPRVVFLSGLEAMDTTTRREITERLNLLRDSWAPHPARIIFWLPSWGLAEFRRIAPDLFDWRSGLITLNDADLPIRSELEYLVWACERYGGLDSPADTWRWSGRRHPPRRLVLVGLNPAERHPMLRGLALGLAKDALASTELRLRSSEFEIPVSLEPSDHGGPPLVPVLIRSQDAVGLLDDHSSLWYVLAQAAGIPGPDSAANVLATLAAQGRLVVLLDAFDLMALDAGRRWLERLLAVTPPIQLFATTAGPPVGLFATWTPYFSESVADDIEENSEVVWRYARLVTLLTALFPPDDDLVALARYFLGDDLDELRLPATHREIVTRLVIACARRNLLDSSFFAELTRMRPAHAAEIEAVARSLAHA